MITSKNEFYLQTFYLQRVERTPINLAFEHVISSRYNLITRFILTERIPTYLMSGNLKRGVWSLNDDAIIFTDSLEYLARSDQANLLLLCSRQCLTYMIILTREYENQQEFKTDVGKLVQVLWKKTR